MWLLGILLDIAGSGFTFELTNVAYTVFGIGVGLTLATLKVNTRLALVELRLANIESAINVRRPPALVSPPSDTPLL